MKQIEQVISPLIESQFPALYREEGPVFIQFVKAYYEWLEQTNNALYYSRRLPSLRDIDQTVDDFIVYFKQQFLKDIQFDIATNKRLLVKNALDLYRSKGTERAVELFFKLVYGQSAKVYYPGDDIFRLSDGVWKQPIYLEVSDTPYNDEYEGKEIRGLTSGATAFVDNISTTKKVNELIDITGTDVKSSKDIHLFFLSNIKGAFQTGEHIAHSGTIDPRNTTKIVGSLNDLVVVSGGANYTKGDIVVISSSSGTGGKAIVTETTNTSGQAEFLLIEGGWGFSTSPQILISERVFTVNNVITQPTTTQTSFTQFEYVTQPKANIQFTVGTGTFSNNDFIYSYANSTSGLTGLGKILTISSNSTQGNLYVSVVSGNLQMNSVFYNSINSVSASISNYTDLTSYANVIAVSKKAVLYLSNNQVSNTLVVNEEVFQSNSGVEYANGVIESILTDGANLVISVANVQGVFLPNTSTIGRSTSANLTLVYYSSYLGILDTSTTSVADVSVISGGQNYANGESVLFQSNTGTGARAQIVTNGIGNAVSVILFKGGTGYITPPTATVVNTAVSYFFNANTDVSVSDDFITLSGHTFSNTQAVRYNTSTGNTPLTGLTNNSIYYVKTSNTTGITLSTAPQGTIIQLTKGLTETGHLFTSIVSSGSEIVLQTTLGKAWDYQIPMLVRGSQSNSTGTLVNVSQGSLASFKVGSLDDQETVSLNTDLLNDVNVYGAYYADIRIDGDGNTALSGSNSYGFPGLPTANSTTGQLGDIFAFKDFTIGTIASIVQTGSGEDYNQDPLVTVIEPVVTAYQKSDIIFTMQNNVSSYQEGEALLIIGRRFFNGNSSISSNFISLDNNYYTNNNIVTYITAQGTTPLSGLTNNSNYFIVSANDVGVSLSSTQNGTPISITPSLTNDFGHFLQNGSYSKIALLKQKSSNNILTAKRASMFGEIPQIGSVFLKGETSGYTDLVLEVNNTSSYSGFNASVEANVVTADGAVTSLRVIDSGVGFGNYDIVTFNKENSADTTVGTARAITYKQGAAEGFYENTKGFLSSDKYLHDGEYYQEYSYEVNTRVPFEKYSDALKKVLHVAGTKMFAATEIESNISAPITVSSQIVATPYVATAFDFINYTDVAPTVTFTRASSGTYFDSAGVLQTAAINVPRYTYDPISLSLIGLMTEPARTNSIRNNTMVGAVAGTPGTLPTNWTTVAIPGVAQTVVGTGTESNIAYMDVRFFGTPTASSFVNIVPDILVAGSSGQTWTGSFWTKLVAGSLTNTSVFIEMRESNASQAFLTNSVLNLSVDNILRRYALTRTLNNATTAFVSVREVCQVTNGLPIDFTIRIGLPQLELGAFATSVIQTSTTAATRAADFNFVDYNYLDSKISFTRNCPATYFDSSGILRTTSNNSPRYDYNPITNVKRGLLIEEARTNLLTSSFISGAADWTFTAATVTNNSTTAPDGINTATKIVEDTSSTTRGVSKSATISAGSTLTASVFVKPFSNNRHFRVQVTSNSGVNGFRAYFNLITKTVALQTAGFGTGTAISNSASITEVGNGWIRLICSGTVDPAATTVTGIGFMQDTPTGSAIYTGDGVSGLYIWGAQIEVGSFATSYIPTLDSTVTRLADTTLVSGSNFNSGWYYPSDGTLYSEYTINVYAPSSAFPVSTSLTYGTATGNSVILAATNVTNKLYSYSEVKTNTVTQAGFYAGTSASFFANTTIKSAVAYTLNDFAFSTTSVTQQTDNIGTIPTVDRLGIGCIGGSANYLNGWIRKVTYYPVRLSNSELQTLVV